MIEVISGNWKVTRQVGIGDRERVRSGLLQVAAFCHREIDLQARVALDVAKRNGRTLRFYVNAVGLERARPKMPFHLERIVFGASRDHDLMLLGDSLKDFNYAVERVDIFIEPLSGELVAADLSRGINELWRNYDREKFNVPAAKNVNYETARERYPEHAVDLEHYFRLFLTGTGG